MQDARRDQMDGLRALCFGCVFGFHAWPRLFPWGGSGVYVFFALSGFLVAGILAGSTPNRRSLGDFYVRRCLRICPACFFTLALISLRWPVEGPAWYLAYAENLLFAAVGTWPASPTGHFWTLAVEFQFYLLFPLAYLFAPPRSRAALLVGLILASKLCRAYASSRMAEPWASILTPCCAEYLLWGALVAGLPRPSPKVATACVAIGSAMLAAWVAWTFSGDSGRNYVAPWLAVLSGTPDGVGSALLVYGLWWSRGRLSAWLSVAPLAYLGRVSYGLYLYHVAALMLLVELSGSVPGLWRVEKWAALALTLATAALSWHFLERPVVGLGRGLRASSAPSRPGPHETRSAPCPPAPGICRES